MPNPEPIGVTNDGTLELHAPLAPDSLDLMPDDVGRKIPVTVQSTGLRVEVPELPPGSDVLDPGDITVFYWYWDTTLFATKRLEAPYDESDLPDVDAVVPSHLMDVAGLHSLRYGVVLRESSSNPTVSSFITLLDSDKEGPNRGQRGSRLRFAAVIDAEGVTDEYLDNPANGDRVIGTIDPLWLDARLGDIVTGYLTQLPFRKPARKRNRRLDVVATTVITQEHKDGIRPVELHFRGDDLRRLKNVEYNAHYYLKDRSGRESGPSLTAPLLINLTPTPTELRAVQIPQLADGLINLDDAREKPDGVYMQILQVFGAAAGDFLHPFWDRIELSSIRIAEIQAWPINVPIPYSKLASGGYEYTPGVIRAEYNWRRGTAPARPSVTRFVPVDLTVAGNVSPDNPDPINRLLPVVTVKGRDGDNQLSVNDEGLQVRVVTLLYDDPKPGELLELMAGTLATPIAEYEVKLGDKAGKQIEWFVEWAIIELLGGGLVPFFYWTFNGVNRQRARDTQVLINIIPIVGLKDLEYVGVTYGPGPDAGFISCPLRPWVNGVGVKIPGDESRLAWGDEVKLHWASYAHPAGFSGAVIPETIHTFTHTLTGNEHRDGYTFQVPFVPYIKAPGLVEPAPGKTEPRHGSAVSRYQVIKPVGAGMGYSGRRLVYIKLTRLAGQPPCLSDD
ncbi:hypothetical protein SAMN04490182_0663 [Pseudomonas cedrina]|uniref:Uncharacterized protein n=2 Tax=Pseudomonas cedrina TaxID=651740 RepID=A0A1V2KFP4_PSECE|nr:hypothetical protein [Pseudomonas cedrina]ONH56533.1 hypothetical protein BLL36_03935 [Pseudomonas cedrina subsp. cedrina]SDS06915.1 hypothetical protein SAMN04490182_0663 [Pseudomonas cedrina]